MDGVYINICGKGWKEVKVGTVFEITPVTHQEKLRRLKRQGQSVKAGDEIRNMVKAEAVSLRYMGSNASLDS